jgi:hypothetical protein
MSQLDAKDLERFAADDSQEFAFYPPVSAGGDSKREDESEDTRGD